MGNSMNSGLDKKQPQKPDIVDDMPRNIFCLRIFSNFALWICIFNRGIMAEEGDKSNKRNQCRLIVMFTMTFGFFLVEISVGYFTNSVALVADSFHMLSDLVALLVAFFSVKMAPKAWSNNTYGWARAEVLGAMVNSVLLVALCFSILIESINRFLHQETIDKPQLILVVGAIGLLINIIGILMFHQSSGGSHHGHGHHGMHSHVVPKSTKKSTKTRDASRVTSTAPSLKVKVDEPSSELEPTVSPTGSNEASTVTQEGSGDAADDGNDEEMVTDSASQMNIHGVFLHLLGDALGSVVVVISAIIIWQTNWKYKLYVDPTLSIILVAIIICSAIPLLKSSTQILLQNVPAHIQIEELERKLRGEIKEVTEVHDFHIWQLAGDKIIATAHIRCRNVDEYIEIAPKIKAFFHREGIHSTTIQPEYTEEDDGTVNPRVGEICMIPQSPSDIQA